MLLSDCCMKPVLIEDVGKKEVYRCAKCFRPCYVTDRSRFRLEAIIKKVSRIPLTPKRMIPYCKDKIKHFFRKYDNRT